MRTTVAIVAIGVLIGLAVGLGGYTFIYAKGYSYLTNDPAACANCHVMRDYYGAWLKGPHRKAAVCNDCHTPHGLIPKYMTKAENGFWHSFYFTSGRYPDNLEIRQRSRRIVDGACLKCHTEITQAILTGGHGEATDCVRCHMDVGHME